MSNPTNPAEDKIINLARTFPLLRDNAPGIDPWDPEELDEWAAGVASSGERHAAQFVLEIWNRHPERKCGRFSVVEAMNTWDADHRDAFVAWARDPFSL